MDKIKELYWNHHIRHWVGILVLMALSVLSVNFHYEAGLLLTSIYDAPEHAPFDGTVMPVQVMPDWSELSGDEYYMDYHELDPDKLIGIPEYRDDYLTFPTENLVWGNDDHDVIRNAKITYPVPYTGNYELDDCGEGCGSHPAVDIKAPEGTPVYAIANGVAVDAGWSNGFGNSITIKHRDVPDPNGVNQNTTLYSSYSHLSTYYITENDVVTKGEIIGEIGGTGTATTNHLHFQLDNDNAPWHPYWPFTTAEASAAGYGFWDAVSNGVGMDNVYAYTHNPMDFVYEHMSYVYEETPLVVVEGGGEEEEEVVVEGGGEEEEEVESSVVTIDFDDVEVDAPDMMMIGDKRQIEISLLDSSGDVIEDPGFDGQIEVSVSDDTVAKLNRGYLEAVDFDDGEATLDLYADHEGSTYLSFEIAGHSFYSTYIYMIDDIQPFGQFGIASDGNFTPGIAETIQIQALTLGGEPTPTFNGDGTVEVSVIQGSATLSEDELTKKDFSTGVAEVELTADSDDSVVLKVVYGTKEVESDAIYSQLFTDFDDGDDYYDAVSYLYMKGTVQGYPDGSFKPDVTVSRVEALKFIFSGMDQDVTGGLVVNFNDTSSGQWYSDYLATAYSLGVVQGYNDGSFKPTQGVNRVEFLKMLFTTMDISVDPIVIEDPYGDVNNLSWYAAYVQYAKEKNLFPLAGSNFEPSTPMSRLEIAEVIYRLIAVNQNEGESYSVLLRVQ
jgi:hypothetical protein